MKQLFYAKQNIIRGKNSTFVKIVSLTLGLFISIILFARVAFELNYDTFYQDVDRVYIIKTAWNDEKDGLGDFGSYIIYPTAGTILNSFPEQVESATTLADFCSNVLVHGNTKHKGNIIMADSLYFPTMGIQLYEGNPLDLAMPGVVFLSRSFASEIFGSENPIGKSLEYPMWGKEHSLLVKGIYADIPENTSQNRSQAVVSMSSLGFYTNPRLDWTSGGNYKGVVRLKHKGDAAYINDRINPIIANYLPMEHFKSHGTTGIKVEISPLAELHLENEKVMTMIYIMLLLGFALLLTATLNYVLISISSLSYRAKGVGIHKCNGAGLTSIFGMFLWETAIIVGIAVLLVCFLILNFQDKIQELTGVSLKGLFDIHNLWAPILVVLFLFVVGSILPGKLFSSISVTRIFHRYSEGKKQWKYPLLFFQFGGTAFLLGVMCIVFAQYHYVMSKDLGYNTERLAYVYHSFPQPENTLSNLRHLPYVEKVATADWDMTEARSPFHVKDNSGNILFTPRMNWFDKDFYSFIGIKLKAGKFPSRSGEILVNPEFVKEMGWTGSGVGEVVPEHGTVTGVLDGYFLANRAKMPPFEIQCLNEKRGDCFHVRLKEPFDDNFRRLNEDMKKLYPQDEVIFKSHDSELKKIFHSTRIFRDSTLLASIAILAVTLMGLIGYTNDEVRRRSKEIAIRKINGAKAISIMWLLSRDVSYIALPSVVIGIILAAYAGELWLSMSRDIMPVNPLLYIGAAIMVLAFIFGCVLTKVWRIANANPILSIRNE